MIPTRLPHVSDMEAMLYYRGLPSNPRLIARTGEPWPWENLSDPEIHEIWEDNLAFKVHASWIKPALTGLVLKSSELALPTRPWWGVVLWIGVWDWHTRKRPAPLAYDVATDAVLKCKALLLEHGIGDVEVEMRQSDIVQCGPFTTSLGIPLCTRYAPWAGGTGGVFLQVDDPDGKKLFLITARHAVLHTDNSLFERKSDSQPRHDVHIDESSFHGTLRSVEEKTASQAYIVNYQKSRMDIMADREDATAKAVREDAQSVIKKLEAQVQALKDFKVKLLMHWITDTNRTLGHVIYSPPIGTGTEQRGYTRDVAVIAIEPSKIDPDSFTGNVIDLGNKYTPDVLTPMMRPNHRDAPDFDEMRNPNVDNWSWCNGILVLKRGGATGLTVGRALNFFAYARKYVGDNDDTIVSKEWAVISEDESTVFSAPGDSGSAVVDGAGRIGGIITSGCGYLDEFDSREGQTDVTYVTPIDFVMEVIRGYKPLTNAYIDPPVQAVD
ncbi:hypothetical protein BC826DRAFT_1027636 [Russula brevipes]|nr:hypothetical protein BC826DRAFT_1027636 [Russula brevipes]